ncbi:IclR family transcriptional regulator [Marinibaculum pumilum]|uniref:IclR family transcriptional regulator n=1 Tax=Marinibaculum pumilum TaxID=1766165 RepID=A0ABV7L828_9PROT
MSIAGAAADHDGEEARPRTRGIQSVDQAMTLLRALAAAPGPLSLTALSAAAGMPPSKAHRYLASLVAGGLAVQRRRSGQYDLGPLAMELGLAALSRLQLVNRAADLMPPLVEATGATALLAVWSNAGPVIVRWERAARYAVTTLGLGSVLPLTRSATGHVFLAWLPERLTAEVLALEKGTLEDTAPDRAELLAMIDRVRRDGMAQVDGRLIPGLYAASVPVLNWQDEAEAAITLIGPLPELTAPGSPAVAALRAAGREASVRKG